MNKKIVKSVLMIGAVLTMVTGATVAYFSDTETSTGNTFTAGTIDISLDSNDGQAVTTVSGDLDLKPSQTGWTTAVVTNDGTNPAEVWKHIKNVVNEENGIVEPEQEFYNENPGSNSWLMSNWIHYDMLVTKPAAYSFEHTQSVSDGTVGDLEVTVTEDGDWMVWTFDFPVEQFTGDGNLNVGLIIALNGEGNGPAYQIHNNDGADSSYPWGTWLMSPWGPTITDGWFGWHSGDTNTPVTTLAWVGATGNRNVPHNDGVMEIRILKSELGDSFHWAASPTVGSGFNAPAYDVTMQIPTGFGWGTPLVTMSIPNYIEATRAETILEIPESEGFYLTDNPQENGGVGSHWMYLGVLEPAESMTVKQSYHLDGTVDNWAQSDRVWFDIDFMAQQTTPLPEEPDNVLSGHGRP